MNQSSDIRQEQPAPAQGNKTTPPPPTSRERALANRQLALQKIDQARYLLSEAAGLTCPLRGFSRPWKWIGDHMDKTKVLWHRVNNATLPTSHDGH